ncbi:hypothetical protein JB92DRAFT_3149757 [Gautieria morchelliformis]|nr:hypothetical protein JB92DRAFT_3149757 [Gautieria morchelliformis]
MAHHSDTTLSEPPLSPFSTHSDGTQTSDEPADLGAFTSVFRVMNQLQQQQQTVQVRSRSDSRAPASHSENESDVGGTSTVWSHRPIASYLDRDDTNESTRSLSTSNSPEALSEEERGSDSSDTEGFYDDTFEIDGITPSLGDLDSALGFLAAEKAKLAASHLDGRSTSQSSTGESVWRHVIEPKRKRRRKRRGALGLSRTLPQDEETPAGARTATIVATPEASSSQDSASSPDKTGTSPPQDEPLPSTSRPSPLKARPLSKSLPQPHQHMSSSPPTVVSHSLPTPPDPRLLRLRALAKKLRHDFPQNDSQLKHVLVDDYPNHDIIDPRGPEPQFGDALTHVFIDHSNILIGFVNNVKRTRRSSSGRPLLFFPALQLILERGRPISRRILAASSPLYQNMDTATDLGYSLHVYVRVPDFSGDSANGTNNTNTNNTTTTNNGGSSLNARTAKSRKPAPVQTHTTSLHANTTTESDPGQIPSPTTSRAAAARPYTHSRSISASTASTTAPPASTFTAPSNSGTGTGRVRYREQGVDELLQLKLHQALVSPDADPPPPGATIVLATGDGASGQFNEDGFVGVVRTALNKGWMVELYAWGGGISGAWRKIAEEEGRGRLKIWEMDRYAGDLLEVAGGS